MTLTAEAAIVYPETSVAFENRYVPVDMIPEMAALRQGKRNHADALLEHRRLQVTEGSSGREYLHVDALSTAHAVLLAERVYGPDSQERQEIWEGLLLDSQRLVGEWYRKKKSEYFPPVRQYFDEETSEYHSHDLSLARLTENGIVPIPGNPEEEERRKNEYVEDATPHIVRKVAGAMALGGMLEGGAIRTISECTDKAIADLEEDRRLSRPHRGYDGYVPEIAKFMIRDIRFDATSNDRFEEQLALPGLYITDFVIQKTLELRGVNTWDMDKTQRHGNQLFVRDDLMEFACDLDTIASEEWCTNVFMGEEVPKDYIKNYETFRQEALARQESLKGIAERVARFTLDLAADDVDRRQAPAKVGAFVKLLLLDLAKSDNAVAEQMFDTETAHGLQQVAHLESIGETDKAFLMMQEVLASAPGGGFCGAGSCGIESVDLSGGGMSEILAGLNVQPGETVVRDMERACKCGAREIYYSYSSDTVRKFCNSCKVSGK